MGYTGVGFDFHLGTSHSFTGVFPYGVTYFTHINSHINR